MKSAESQHTAAASPFTHLVWQARDGDLQAFRQLYDATVARVFALCLRLTADRMASDDLCQETFIKAWRALPRFNGDSRFETWLYRIAVNASVDWLRKKRPEAAHEIEYLSDENRAAQWDGGNMAERIDLENAIARLPEKARQVLVLFDIEGYSHDEIAAMLGVSTGTTKSQLHRARKLLLEMMK
jgi:RNA polymerase sigma-70 factor (ECF subfamily)